MSKCYFVMPEWSAKLGKVYRIYCEEWGAKEPRQRPTDRVFLDRKTAAAAADMLTAKQGGENAENAKNC